MAGGNYVGAFTIAGTGTALLSIGEIARAPGQTLAIPAAGYGFPIVLDGAAGATTLSFTLQYDPSALTVRGFGGGALPKGSAVQVDTSTPGSMHVTIRTPTPLKAGRIVLGLLDAVVPTTATYGADALLHLAGVQLDAGARTVRAADGLEVVARLGDTSGDGAYSLLDVERLARVLLHADSGFGAWPLVDPTVLADIDRNGILQWADALELSLQVLGLPQKDIPGTPAPAPSPGDDNEAVDFTETSTYSARKHRPTPPERAEALAAPHQPQGRAAAVSAQVEGDRRVVVGRRPDAASVSLAGRIEGFRLERGADASWMGTWIGNSRAGANAWSVTAVPTAATRRAD